MDGGVITKTKNHAHWWTRWMHVTCSPHTWNLTLHQAKLSVIGPCGSSFGPSFQFLAPRTHKSCLGGGGRCPKEKKIVPFHSITQFFFTWISGKNPHLQLTEVGCQHCVGTKGVKIVFNRCTTGLHHRATLVQNGKRWPSMGCPLRAPTPPPRSIPPGPIKSTL